MPKAAPAKPEPVNGHAYTDMREHGVNGGYVVMSAGPGGAARDGFAASSASPAPGPPTGSQGPKRRSEQLQHDQMNTAGVLVEEKKKKIENGCESIPGDRRVR